MIFLLGIVLLPNKIYYIVLFTIYLILVFMIFNIKEYKKVLMYSKARFLVKYMIVLMVLLDSIFIVGAVGIYPAIISLTMLIPTIVLGRKINMT